MIISRTPFRVSFFGGGTDYPAWYLQHGGAVLGTTIDKYCYLTCRYLPPFFDHRIRVVYSKIENCQSVDEIIHPAVRAVLRNMNIERGVEIHHDGDLPARSGMGSSSAFTVGLLHAIYALKGQMPNRHQLAVAGIHVEQMLLKEAVGSQDQVLVAYGGFNQIVFSSGGEITVRPMTIGADRIQALNDHLMLFYTGIKRTASDVATTYLRGLRSRSKALHALGGMVDEGIAILNSQADLSPFGELLNEAWRVKRDLSRDVSNAYLDDLYEHARAAGAVGGKVIGAGGGGFIVLFVPPSLQQRVRDALCRLIQVPFRFEFSGSQIIFHDPEQDYSAEERFRASQSVDGFRELRELQRAAGDGRRSAKAAARLRRSAAPARGA